MFRQTTTTTKTTTNTESLPQTLTQSPPGQKLGTARGRSLQSRRTGLRDTLGPAKTPHLQSIGRRRSRQSRCCWRWHALSTTRSRWTRNDAGRNFQRLFWWRHAGGSRRSRNALLFDWIWTRHALSCGWWTGATTRRTATTTAAKSATSTRWCWHAAAIATDTGDFVNVLLFIGYIVLRWRRCENHARRKSIF